MNHSRLPFAAVVLLAGGLSGCTGEFLNEGATRVRSSVVAPNADAARFEQIYFKPNQPAGSLIETGTAFSITLLSAYICDFRESRGLDVLVFDDSNAAAPGENGTVAGCTNGGARAVSGKDRTTRGEIAIIANVGESSASKSLVTNRADEKTKGRVVYYNDDVRESGQLINALNLPIYGPKKYEGKNVFFELSMLELDNDENAQMKSLLQSLAGIGGKAYPPSAPILGVLNSLGSALLSGNSDDVEMRFQMRFDVKPPDTGSYVYRLPLAEGYYAFVREENRDNLPEWHNFAVNEKDGVLCRAKSAPEPGATGSAGCIDGPNSVYRERTWFLVRIARETDEAALDIEHGELLGRFLERLETHQAANYKETKAALDSVDDALKALVCSDAQMTAAEQTKRGCGP